MSPEQAAAAPGIDARADVYAFGVLAYELFAGRPPFEGRSPQALLFAHVSETPEPVQKLRPSLPSALSGLIMRCLEKRPADRPQRASDIVHALDAITTPSGGSAPTLGLPLHATGARPWVRRRTLWTGVAAATVLAVVGALVVRERLARGTGRPVMLAVLPFENHGPAADDYFGDGLADAITNRLASLPTLGVIAQRSASQYKHSPKPLSQIGRELGVQYVLQGAVRWQTSTSGERKAQVSPSLVRVSDGMVRWAADPYTVAPVDVFAVQSEIAARVASALDVSFSASGPTLTERPTANPAAYDAYLRGVALESQYLKDAYDIRIAALAAEQFERAVHLDTTFALAEAKLAFMEVFQLWASGGASSAATRLRQSVNRALELSPNLADAHLVKGLLLQLVNGDVPGSNAELQRALDLRPGDAMILQTLGGSKSTWGDSTGLPMIARSVELDPLNAFLLPNATDNFIAFRHFAEARHFAEQWQRLQGDNPDPLVKEASIAIAERGDTAEAMRLWEKAEHVAPRPTGTMLGSYGQIAQGTARVSALTLRSMLARSLFDTVNYIAAKGAVAHRLGQRETAAAYGDSLRAVLVGLRTVPGLLAVQNAHALALSAAWLSDRTEEYAGEADTIIAELSRSGGDRSMGMATFTCRIARDYAGAGDVVKAISYGRRCLTLPSGYTVWNVRLSPDWQRILSDSRVQAFLREFAVRTP
jgi:serine/threonine-protein kinase